jgi:uncharacterized protein (TIGR01777 family)
MIISEKMKTVLITGGTGLVGSRLTELLIEKGYRVLWLSRERKLHTDIPTYRWDYRNNEIDNEALEQANVIVHLAGSNLGEGRWTEEKKRQIVESRVRTAEFLLERLKLTGRIPEAFISASATGYYGAGVSERIFTEEDVLPENDFLNTTCRKWEDAACSFNELPGIRTVVLRTGFILSRDSEAFKKMVLPTRLGVGSPLGSGRQYLSWIHLDDICRLYIKAIEDSTMQGVYNAVAPEYITNAVFMRTLAKVMKKPFFFPAIPVFMMRLVMGEAADMVLGGSRISSQKIQDARYRFQYERAEKAITASLSADGDHEGGKAEG